MFLTKLRSAGGALALVAVMAVGLSAVALPSDHPGAPPGKGAAKSKPAADPKVPAPKAPERGPAGAAEGTDRGDWAALQGLWVLDKADLGKAASSKDARQAKELVGKMQILVAGDIWWGMLAGQLNGTMPARIKLDQTKNPKWLDIDERDGHTSRCIYELEGDRFRICVSEGERAPRPAEFTADDDSRLVVMEFRREKLPPAAGEKAILGSWAGEASSVQEEVNGPWKHTSAQRAEILDSYLFAFSGEKGRGKEWFGGKYTVDATKNPRWIDVELVSPIDDGKVTKLYGCYEVANGQLKLALGSKRATRPLEFKEGEGIHLLELRPAKIDAFGRCEVPEPKPNQPRPNSVPAVQP